MSVARHSLEKQRLAKELYIQGKSAYEIGDLIGCSHDVVRNWSIEGNWKELRSASNVSRTELRNKLLVVIDSEVKKYKGGTTDANMGDTLVKLTAAVKNLDTGISIVDIIEIFTAFTKWLENLSQHDPKLTVPFRKSINTYLDSYVKFKTQGQ